MNKEMTIKEFASKGGHARAKVLSKKRRLEISRLANKAKLTKQTNKGYSKKVIAEIKSLVKENIAIIDTVNKLYRN